jgi:hypothetical protein
MASIEVKNLDSPEETRPFPTPDGPAGDVHDLTHAHLAVSHAVSWSATCRTASPRGR